MNLLGKWLTVFIFVTCLVMMVVSLFVVATHRNWKEDYQALKQQYDAAVVERDQLTSQKNNLESSLTAELEIARQDAGKLATEREQLLSQNTQIQRELDDLRQQQRSNTAAAESTQINNEKLTAQVESMRSEIRDNQQARDRAFNTTVAATDELHEAQGQLTALRDRNVQLSHDLADKVALLDSNGIDPSTDASGVVPQVRGLVSRTQRSGGVQLIEISVGADDGLKPGHTIEVYRGDRYLGRAEILKTEPDRAVGRVMRQFQQGQIEEGDNVATRFRIG